MTGRELLSQHREAIEALCRKYAVERLMLFGSAVRDDWEPGRSDIDFVIDLGPCPPTMHEGRQFLGLMVELEKLLGCRVDLVERAVVKRKEFLDSVSETWEEWYAA